MSRSRSSWVVIGVVALSTPLALLLETGLRIAIFPPEFEDIRMWLRPVLTTWMWLGPVLAVAFTAGGVWLRRKIVARNVARLHVDKRTPKAVSKAEFDALMLSTSAPQIPAVVATLGFMFGSSLEPAAATVLVSMLGVVIVGRPSPSSNTQGS